MLDFVVWAVATLGIVTLTIVLAERYGVEIAVGIFASLTVIANILAVKRIAVASLIGPAGVLVYSSTFLITDILGEIYGKEYGKKAVIAGFFANIVALVSILIAVNWQPAPSFAMPPELEKAFEDVFSFAPRIVIASMIAYLVSQTHDVYAFHFWKTKTGGKYLWLRNNASTIVSQLIDTVLFITIAFYGVVPTEALLGMIFGQYVIKVAIALLDTPFMYIATYTWKVISPNSVN
ncbi:queuosine precursor transporter [Archaeoglobus veneficus]|uniref:Probable queuosine precursor transporter n=1 Tax=Archaeoglobus veneficus (strain DSM 11195 / SNP6) TaxID=693661 RepID=F2KN13_ARCVS|nr:queuosine precursor transporter [Archaeoglobus veneficus]AEA47289.1 protein of unknown function DUF165 [Archaeoglobus veneficus SNP6]